MVGSTDVDAGNRVVWPDGYVLYYQNPSYSHTGSLKSESTSKSTFLGCKNPDVGWSSLNTPSNTPSEPRTMMVLSTSLGFYYVQRPEQGILLHVPLPMNARCLYLSPVVLIPTYPPIQRGCHVTDSFFHIIRVILPACRCLGSVTQPSIPFGETEHTKSTRCLHSCSSQLESQSRNSGVK